MKPLFLLLSLISSVSAFSAEEINITAHKKCKLRSGNDYKDCYIYYSRIEKKRIKSDSSLMKSDLPLINSLRNYGEPTAYITDKQFLRLHFKLMYAYWHNIAKKRGSTLPPPILRLDSGYLIGCGKKPISKYPNIYCTESSEITIDPRPLIKGLTDKKNLNLSYLSLAILSHEFGHHVNHHIGREKYLNNEENEADWRAGKYFAYAISKNLIPLKGLTKNANLFFSIGDFHMLSKHDNPKNRFNAFMKGFNDESMGVGTITDGWLQDTKETFSRRDHRKSNFKSETLYFDVFRFEIERGRQVAGNIIAGVIGAINCSQGTKEECANSLLIQGQAKPEGWFRERKLILDCQNKIFDVKGDGFKPQQISADRKGQAQYLYKRYC